MAAYSVQPDVQEHMACSGTYGVQPGARDDHHAMRNRMTGGQRIEGASAHGGSCSTGSTQNKKRGIRTQDEGLKTPHLLSSFIYIDHVHKVPHVLHVLHVHHACHELATRHTSRQLSLSRTGPRQFLSALLPHVT